MDSKLLAIFKRPLVSPRGDESKRAWNILTWLLRLLRNSWIDTACRRGNPDKEPTWWCEVILAAAAAAAAAAAGNKKEVILDRSKSMEVAEFTDRWWWWWPPFEDELEWPSFGSFGFRGPLSCCTAVNNPHLFKGWILTLFQKRTSSVERFRFLPYTMSLLPAITILLFKFVQSLIKNIWKA